MIKFLQIIILLFYLFTQSICSTSNLKFYEEPTDTYLTKNQPAILKCKIENARTGFFKCNDQWSQDASNSRIIQIGNKQILTIELAITRSQLDEYKKSKLNSNQESLDEFWCTCQGWLNSADDTIISEKAYVKLSYINHVFEWEPMPTSGLIGKSVEIRCLPPEGEPKPIVYWLKNGQPIEKTNKRVLVSHEGSLLINEVRSTDSANYTCVAENLAGKRNSDPAQLTVTENKGWSEWSNWTECTSLTSIICGEGTQKRFRTCQNPPTINNAIGCDGFPTQTITCYIPCNSANLLSENTYNINNVIESKQALSEYSSQYKNTEAGYWWTAWSSWSMTCNNDCLRSRKRECKPGYILPSGKLFQISEDPTLKFDKCPGNNIEFSNCTFYCEKVSNTVTIPTREREFSFSTLYILAIVVLCIFLFVIIVTFIIIKRKKKNTFINQKKCLELQADIHPIYYSVQPDYSQDGYMDASTLLPNNLGSQLNSKMYGYECGKQKTATFGMSNFKNQNFLNTNAFMLDERCNTSHNSSTSTGSNSTTSSKIKLSSSPTDSLVKNSNMSEISSHNNFNCSSSLAKTVYSANLNTNENCFNLDDDYENNAFQIMRLINEQKTFVCQAKSYQNQNSDLDLYIFSLYKSGGIIEIPKYSTHILIPDETFANDISAGILKSNDENILNLKEDSTLLSSIFVIKTYDSQNYSKPVILSMDHCALFAESDWDTSIYYKSFNKNYFEEIKENSDINIYSQLVSNRFYLMTDRDGMYALVGRPKLNNISSSGPSIKEMKYSILLIDGEIRVYLIQNTKGANEILNEQIQKSNAKIIKMPDTFELNYPKLTKLENSYLNLELNITYNNMIINSDSTCRKIRMSDIWNSSCDYIEIQIPFSLNGQSTMNHKLTNNNNNNNNNHNRINFDLKVTLELENKLLFSYSYLNTNTSELHTANCDQQEFYSSVSVNPVFIPLKITNLLDEYVLRCFKMNTLKKNDWKLFANLLKFDTNVQYFACKENSFELILSLWLMINLSRSNNDDSLTVNLISK